MGHLLDLPIEARLLICQYYLQGLHLEVRQIKSTAHFKVRYIYCSEAHGHRQRDSHLRGHEPGYIPSHTEQCLPYRRGLALACRQTHADLQTVEAQHTELIMDYSAWLRFEAIIPPAILHHIKIVTVRGVSRARFENVSNRSARNSLTHVLPSLEEILWVSNESFFTFGSLRYLGETDYIWMAGEEEAAREAIVSIVDPVKPSRVKPSRDMRNLHSEIQVWAKAHDEWLRTIHSGSYLNEIALGVVRFRRGLNGDKSLWNATVKLQPGCEPWIHVEPSYTLITLLEKQQRGAEVSWSGISLV